MFNLGWGNSVAVREAFLNTYHQNPMILAREELMKFDYPAHEGDPELVEITKKVILRQTGKEYKHVFLVNGATGGVAIALRAYQQMGMGFAMTREAPFYTMYPKIIDAAGLKHIQENPRYPIGKTVILLDLPSNPLGLSSQIGPVGIPVIIDGVYLNRVYANLFYGLPPHTTMIGSYSKLTGVNGIRVGWLATDDDMLAHRFNELTTAEYCGLATASSQILKHTLQGFNWDHFEMMAKAKLDHNRDEFSKLERFFGDTPVSDTGMFYYGPMDQKAQEIFTKANITWTKGSSMGTDDSFARFNLGQSNEMIEQAVRAVLKADRIK